MQEPPAEAEVSATAPATTQSRLAGPLILAGGALVAGIGGLFFYLAHSAAKDYETSWEAEDAGRSRLWAGSGYACGAAGLLGVGVGALAWATTPSRPPHAKAGFSFTLAPAQAGAAMLLSGGW